MTSDRGQPLLSALIVGVLTIVGLVWAAFIERGGRAKPTGPPPPPVVSESVIEVPPPTPGDLLPEGAGNAAHPTDRLPVQTPPAAAEVERSAPGGLPPSRATRAQSPAARNSRPGIEDSHAVELKLSGSGDAYEKALGLGLSALFGTVNDEPVLTLLLKRDGSPVLRKAFVGPDEVSIANDGGRAWRVAVQRIDWAQESVELRIEVAP